MTLIELSIVVTLIIILALMMIPLFGSLRETARGVQCSSQLRQIGIGLLMYAKDNDNFLPPAHAGGSVNNVLTSWGADIWPYIHSDKTSANFNDQTFQTNSPKSFTLVNFKSLFICPTTALHPTPVPGTTHSIYDRPYSYGLNTYPLKVSTGGKVTFTGNDDNAWPMSLSTIKNFSATAMVLEHGWQSCPAPDYFTKSGWLPHRGGSNVVFFDGHLEYRKLEKIPGWKSTAGYNSTFWLGQ